MSPQTCLEKKIQVDSKMNNMGESIMIKETIINETENEIVSLNLGETNFTLVCHTSCFMS